MKPTNSHNNRVPLERRWQYEIAHPWPAGAYPKGLPRNEWDFRASPNPKRKTKKGDWSAGFRFDFLPEDEVGLCWEYEFCRYDVQAAEYHKNWREEAPKPGNFDSLLEHYWRTDPNGKSGFPLVAEWFYKIWPEWPDMPYLSIPLKERLRRCKLTWEQSKPKQLRHVALRDVYRFVVAVKANEPPSHLNGRSTLQLEMLDDVWVIPSHSIKDKLPPIEITAFEVDYAQSDEILIRRFQNWLTQRREDKGYKRPTRYGARINRGDLIALGALRLMDFGMSINDAMDYSATQAGKPLYEDAGEWSRARKRAGEAIYRAC